MNPEMENLWNAAAHPAVEVEVENTRSAAHQAIEDGDLEELSHLLDSGVDPNEVSNGMTLLVHAIDYEADTAIQSNGDTTVTM
ncbi:ankyrin repeat domain-containing protein, partial [Streptomyces sp. AcH 505]|uniref:ankyrin repeat domain-containing protein n=1 Tax=Streptomyces sp. AcH 505 TaxID=352211 RepID=UPI0018E2BEE0